MKTSFSNQLLVCVLMLAWGLTLASCQPTPALTPTPAPVAEGTDASPSPQPTTAVSEPTAAPTEPASSGPSQAYPVETLDAAPTEGGPAQGYPVEQPAETPGAPQAYPVETPPSTPAPVTSLPGPAGLVWEPFIDGFVNPLLITHSGDGTGRLFVVEQPGLIWVIENDARVPSPFLDLFDQVNSGGNEQGLLGLAFHPDFETNGWFYVYYTMLNEDSMVARFQVSASDPNQADKTSESPLMVIPQPYPNHNGGHLAFGPDGYLYIGLGDGGSGGDPENRAQNTNEWLGSMLRLDVNALEPYGIPADNPFANGGGKAEIWAYGLRNPWRFSFDRQTGDLYIGDVGQNQWEEVNFLPAGSPGGANFGWDDYEGTHVYEGTPPAGSVFVAPIWEYQHGAECSVTGGYAYRGTALPEWIGVYLFGDYCSGRVWGMVREPSGTWQHMLLFETNTNITSFGEDEAGELYLVARGGVIYQLRAGGN